MNRITIRKTTNPDHIKQIEAMDAFIFDDGSYLVESMDGYLHYWIAWCKGQPIGYAVAEEYQDGIVFHARSAVLEKYRGQGLQKRLIKARETISNITLFMTYISVENPASINSFISQGYKAHTPDYFYGGQEMLYLCKEIK